MGVYSDYMDSNIEYVNSTVNFNVITLFLGLCNLPLLMILSYVSIGCISRFVKIGIVAVVLLVILIMVIVVV